MSKETKNSNIFYENNYPDFGSTSEYYGQQSNYYMEQEQMDLLTQELEDAENTQSSVSESFKYKPLSSEILRVNQIGPLNTGRIVFGGGVPVGGHAQLTLFRNGAYNFSGHFHVSGAPSYNVALVWVIKDSKGTAYLFRASGRLHGTFESGSRDFDWNIAKRNPAIAAGWRNLERGWKSHWTAKTNINIRSLVNSAIEAVGYAAKVIAIV